MKSAPVASMALNVEGKASNGRQKTPGQAFHGMLKPDAAQTKLPAKSANVAAPPRTNLDALVERLSKSLETNATANTETGATISQVDRPKEKDAAQPKDGTGDAGSSAVALVQPIPMPPENLQPDQTVEGTAPMEASGDQNPQPALRNSADGSPNPVPQAETKAATKGDAPAAQPESAAQRGEQAVDVVQEPAGVTANGEAEAGPQARIDSGRAAENRPVTVLSSTTVAQAPAPDTSAGETAASPVAVSDDGKVPNAAEPPASPKTTDRQPASPAGRQMAAELPPVLDAEPIKAGTATATTVTPPDAAPKAAVAAAPTIAVTPKPLVQPPERRQADEPIPARSGIEAASDSEGPVFKGAQRTTDATERRERIWDRPEAGQSPDATNGNSPADADIGAPSRTDAAPPLPTAPQPVAKPAAPAVTVVAAISTSVSTQALAKALDVNVSAAPSPSTQILKIQLNPGEMGVVTATLRMNGDQISVDLATDNNEAFDRLSSDTDTIVKSLRGLGLTVDQITVSPPQVAANGTANTGDGGMQNTPRRDPQFAQAGGSSGNGQPGHQQGNGQNRGTQDDGGRFAAGGSSSREQRDRGLVI